MAYASGKHAWGISDRSGRRYRLREMKVEWTGAKVGPDEFEPKHPQLFPPKASPDPQALRNPRPESGLQKHPYRGRIRGRRNSKSHRKVDKCRPGRKGGPDYQADEDNSGRLFYFRSSE